MITALLSIILCATADYNNIHITGTEVNVYINVYLDSNSIYSKTDRWMAELDRIEVINDYNEPPIVDQNIFDPNTWTEPNEPNKPTVISPLMRSVLRNWLTLYTFVDFAQAARVEP